MSIRIPLGPVDEEGVRFDRPPSQVRWTEMTNFIINEGRLQSRPGFEVDNHGGPNEMPNVQPSPILSLVEIFNPGSSATGRESYTPGKDTLVPNADDSSAVAAGWSGAFGDIDEGVPDGVAVMSSTTLGSAIDIDFSNPSVTYSTILGVVFHVRARINNAGAWAKLNFYFGTGVSATNLIHSQVVTMRDDGEGNDWEDFYFTLSRKKGSDKPLENIDLTALSITMELDSSESFMWENKTASGNGTHSEWLDVQDGGGGVFTDFRNIAGLVWGPNTGIPSNRWIKSNGNGTRHSLTFGSLDNTYATILNVAVGGFFRKPGGLAIGDSTLQLSYYNAAGTEFSLGNITSLAGRNSLSGKVDSATNPDTEVAWVAADITGGEFGMEKISGAQLACGAFSITVFGKISGGTTVQVDTINAQVTGVTSSNPGGGLTDKTRLFSSNLWHNRYDDDTRSPTITDVTNSVPLDSAGPGWPITSAVLYGQVYLVNGVDPTVRYPNGSDVFEEIATNNSDGATPLTGRTVAAFGNRLFYGWVKDNSTVTPERLSYSKWQDGSTHNHRSAGDFDLLDTPGGIVAMVPLDEQLMAVLKEVGAYVIRRTGNDIFPFIRDVIHFDVGVIGPKTAVPVAFGGANVVMFLGRTSTNGINVYIFDGQQIAPVGNSIARELRNSMNHGTALITAHAKVDPQTNTYWLFIPEGTDSFCKQAWVLNLTTKQWTRAEFPWDVWSSGIWHFPDSTYLNSGSGMEAIGGQPKLVLGTGGQRYPMAANVNIGYDEMASPSGGLNSSSEDFSDSAEQGVRFDAFTPKLTTGDLIKPADMEAVSYRVGVIFKAIDPSNRVLIDVSEDGGKNYSTEQENLFGPNDLVDVRAPVGGTYFVEWDLKPTHAAQVRYRFRFAPEEISFDGTNNMSVGAPKIPQRIEIHDMWLTIEQGADSE